MPADLIRKLGRGILKKGTKKKEAVKKEPPAPHHAGPAREKDAARRHDEEARRRTRSKRRPRTAASSGSDTTPWSIDSFQVPEEEGKLRFHDLDLPEPLMHAVADLDFKYCTPVQAETLPMALEGRNVAGQAQTGTGKTAAFLISVFTRFLKDGKGTPRKGHPRALVLAPTRELVIQIVRDAKDIARHCPFNAMAVYGGMDLRKQAAELESKPIDLVAATPGRLLDFCGRARINLGQVDVLVIDEADRMLDMGFIPDVRRIVRKTPPREKRQTLLFSATLTDDVMRLAESWMPKVEVVKIEPERLAAETVEQLVYALRTNEKFQVLYNLIEQRRMQRVLVFGNRRDTTRRLADRLERYGVSSALLSGDVDQQKRLRILDSFREGRTRVLVATDVAARGLHIDEVDYVINYEFPYESEGYVHRIGRTGRAGAEGTAISFACEDESFIIPEIEKLIGIELPCRQPEEELLADLPQPKRAARPRRQDGQGEGSGGGRSSGHGSGRGRSRSRSSGGRDRRRSSSGSSRGRGGSRRSGGGRQNNRSTGG